MKSIYLILLLVVTTFAGTPMSVETIYSTSYYIESESATKNITITFLPNNMCHITITKNGKIEVDEIHRYMLKGKWAMIKNLNTGAWKPLEYNRIDDTSFQLKVSEADSVKYWRTFIKK